jgi:hypothetical protein
MQYTLKSIVLGHLLVTSFCVSSHAEWNYKILADAEEHFLARGCPEGVVAIQNIDRRTSAAILIAEETLRRIDSSGAKARDLAELREQAESVARVATDIQTRTGEALTTAGTDTDPISTEFTLRELDLEAQAAHTNFTAALDTSHRVQQIIDHKPPYRPACCQ